RARPRRGQPSGRRSEAAAPDRDKTNIDGRCRNARRGPMPLLIKICGLNTPESVDAALDAGADAVGFVFFPPSPRHLGFEAARALGARVRARALKVSLAGEAADEWLAAVIEALRPDMLQLHGKETRDRVVMVRTRFGLPVIKALPIAERGDLAPIRLYASVADRLLFDARAPREATRPGGLGKSFDWRLLEGINPGVPFMLSGGLDADNVAEALRITSAPGVDVSSGVERAPGKKDPDKIRAFVRAARIAAKGGERMIARRLWRCRASPIRFAPAPTSAGISDSMVAASSPRP